MPARSWWSGASGSPPPGPRRRVWGADAIGVDGTEGAGLLEIPDQANARGLREAGVLPDAGPGLAALAINGHGTEEIREALIAGSLGGAILVGVAPPRGL